MAVREYDDGGQRFYVIDVHGWRINPRSTRVKPGGSSKPTTTWAVLDRDNCHREVDVFVPGGGRSAVFCEKAARTLAANLNEQEAACQLAS